MQAKPFASALHGWLALASSLCLTMLFIYANLDLMAVGSLREDQLPVNATLDADVARFNASLSGLAAMGVLMACAIVGSLELYDSHRRQGIASARRLRLKSTKKEVLVAFLPPDQYHLFLSHQWGDAQDQMRVVKQRVIELIPAARVFLESPE